VAHGAKRRDHRRQPRALAAAAVEIKSETAAARLSFEKPIGGDEDERLEGVWAQLGTARRAARLITASRAGAGRFPRTGAATALARPDELKAAGRRRLAASTPTADSRGDAIITAIAAPDPPLIALAAKAADNAEVRRASGESRMTPLRASLAG
jgi:hypothetical protein